MIDKERRRQHKMTELGSRDACCAICGEREIEPLKRIVLIEKHLHLLERHHILGHHEGETIVVCLNHHAILTDAQLDWPNELFLDNRSDETKAVAFFMGLGDLLILLGETCKRYTLIIFSYVKEHGGITYER